VPKELKADSPFSADFVLPLWGALESLLHAFSPPQPAGCLNPHEEGPLICLRSLQSFGEALFFP